MRGPRPRGPSRSYAYERRAALPALPPSIIQGQLLCPPPPPSIIQEQQSMKQRESEWSELAAVGPSKPTARVTRGGGFRHLPPTAAGKPCPVTSLSRLGGSRGRGDGPVRSAPHRTGPNRRRSLIETSLVVVCAPLSNRESPRPGPSCPTLWPWRPMQKHPAVCIVTFTDLVSSLPLAAGCRGSRGHKSRRLRPSICAAAA